MKGGVVVFQILFREHTILWAIITDAVLRISKPSVPFWAGSLVYFYVIISKYGKENVLDTGHSVVNSYGFSVWGSLQALYKTLFSSRPSQQSARLGIFHFYVVLALLKVAGKRKANLRHALKSMSVEYIFEIKSCPWTQAAYSVPIPASRAKPHLQTEVSEKAKACSNNGLSQQSSMTS